MIHNHSNQTMDILGNIFGNNKPKKDQEVERRLKIMSERQNNADARIEDLESELERAHQRIDVLGGKLDALVLHAESRLKDFGNYKNRSTEELLEIKTEISLLIDQVDHVLEILENKAHIEAGKRLRTNLRNHYTRANNAQEALINA